MIEGVTNFYIDLTCFDAENWIVLEYLSNGDLRTFLKVNL